MFFAEQDEIMNKPSETIADYLARRRQRRCAHPSRPFFLHILSHPHFWCLTTPLIHGLHGEFASLFISYALCISNRMTLTSIPIVVSAWATNSVPVRSR